MLRYLATAIFIIPKLIIYPLLWYWRCRRKKACAELELEQEALPEPCCCADSTAEARE